MGAVLDLIKEYNYRIGNCEIIRYDPRRTDVFPPPYLSQLYFLARDSSRRPSKDNLGILPNLFCGMMNLNHDAITGYLAYRTCLLIPVVHTSESEWEPVGLGFPSTTTGTLQTEKSAFIGFAFFKKWWGKPEVLILTILGLAYFFKEFDLTALHGTRYADNSASGHLIRQVGFRDLPPMPRYLLNREGKLTSAIHSTLLIEDFERAALPLLEGIVGNGQRQGQQQ